MKTTLTGSGILIILMAVFLADCKDSNKTSIPAFTGNYVINSAQLSEALTVQTNEAGNISIPAGTDITQLMQTALLSAVSCSSPANSYIELRKDYSLYLSCAGANPFNAGTWIEVSPTALTLNLNSTAIPTSPTGFVLAVTDIVTDQNGMSGKTNVPLPKAMIAMMIAPQMMTMSASAPDVFMIDFSVIFSKK